MKHAGLIYPDLRLVHCVILVVEAQGLEKLDLVALDLVEGCLANAVDDRSQGSRLHLRGNFSEAADQIAID